ncbi:MAG: FkbM family methyltransferase [Blastocatellia bacterium]
MKRLLKRLYEIVPFKKQFYSLLKLTWTPNERIYRHLHFRGLFEVRIDRDHCFRLRHYGYQIENQIFWAGLSGGWEKKSIDLWIKMCPKAKVIFDIGANTGIYALIAKRLNPEARVYALEPVRRVFEKLEQNNSLNGGGIVCVEKAASNASGTATIYDTATEHVLSVTVGKNLNPPEVPVSLTTIETVRLDQLLEDTGLEDLSLIKIDVETHEAEVLEGLGPYLQLYRPNMLIEILDDDVGRRVEALVAGKGYLYFNIDDESGELRQTPHITKSDFYNYLLCDAETAKSLGLNPG